MKNKSKVLAIVLALAMLLGTVSLGTDQANAGVVKKIEKAESQVDCVTGATLTSNGVDAMLKEGLKNVKPTKAEED